METVDEDSGESSICCSPRNAPIIYQWYRASGESELIDRFKKILDSESLLQADRDRFVGEFRALIVQAERGRLRPIHQVKGPMKSEKRFKLFEIKWDREYGKGRELHVRVYHVEPKELRSRSIVIGLHVHKKAVGWRAWSRQTAEIKTAGKRYFVAKADKWGLR